MRACNETRLCERLDAIFEYDAERKKGFGAAYAVWQDGHLLERCYGVSSLREQSPINSRTLFRLASMSKPITAVATLVLVERGLLSLDDSIEKYLPCFSEVKIDDGRGNVSTPKRLPTVRDLLTHTSGIGSIFRINQLRRYYS